MVFQVRWHFRQRISISFSVAPTSSSCLDPHCGQGSARQIEVAGHVWRGCDDLVLPPIRFASQPGTLHRATSGRAKPVPFNHSRPAAH